MQKNMTRKGLAFAAGFALIASGLVGVAPANASGVDRGFVSLIPNAGSSYRVLAGSTFDLRSNVVNSLAGTSGKNLKFLVEDPDRVIKADLDVDALGSLERSLTADAVARTAGNTSLTVTAANSGANALVVGQGVRITGQDDVADGIYRVAARTNTNFTVETVADTVITSGAPTSGATFVALNLPVATTSGAAVTALARTSGESSLTVTATHALAVGQSVFLAGIPAVANGWYRVQTVSTTASFTVTTAETTPISTVPTINNVVVLSPSTTELNERAAILAADLGSSVLPSGASIASSIGGVNTTAGRLANGSFVVDTGTNANNFNRVLRLINADVTKTATVRITAWVDDNNDGVIDPTEDRSPVREVSFHVNGDITVTTALDTPVLGTGAGAGAITGTISISPELNGEQIGNGGAVTANIVTQAGTATAVPTYSATEKLWNIAGTTTATIAQGNYSMRAQVAGAAIGNTATAFVAAPVAVDTEITTAGTVDQQQSFNTHAGSGVANVQVRKDKTAQVVVSAFTNTEAPVPAGRSVKVIFSDADQDRSWTVNGVTVLGATNSGGVTRTYLTDTNGQVVLNVSSGNGLGTIKIEAQPEGLNGADAAKVHLTWATASFSIVDTNAPVASTTRKITTGGSYTYNLFAKDQWNAPLTGAYRVQVTTTGRTNFGGNFELVNGRASFTVSDAAIGSGTDITVSTQLQKQTAGVWASSSDATPFAPNTINLAAASTAALIPLVENKPTAIDAATLSPKAIQAYDVNTSQSNLVDPRGANVAVIRLNMAGVAVGDTMTVSGADMSFAYVVGNDAGDPIRVIGNGSLTFVVAATTDSIQIVSNKALEDAVVTFTHGARTGTAEVSFTAAEADSVKNIAVTAPTSAAPGSTFQVVATLTDAFGNPVEVPAGGSGQPAVRVTYTGPGIVFGQLPDSTDENGQLRFAVLLGSNDTGTASVTVTYNKAAGSTVAANIIARTATVSVGTAAAATTGKVNVGSFNGKLVVYALGLDGARISWKVAGRWGVATAQGNVLNRFDRPVGAAGRDVIVEIYVDRVLTMTKTVRTR